MFTQYDDELNKLFKQVKKKLQFLDDTQGGHGTFYLPFLETQKTWLKYRDSFCAFDSNLSVYNISDDSPMLDNKTRISNLTDERNKYLKSVLKSYSSYE